MNSLKETFSCKPISLRASPVRIRLADEVFRVTVTGKYIYIIHLYKTSIVISGFLSQVDSYGLVFLPIDLFTLELKYLGLVLVYTYSVF